MEEERNMNRHTEQTRIFQALGALAAFILWTAAICYVDVQPIGPEGSAVGFAALNSAFHRFTGVHMALYVITDWLGLFPVAVGFAFGLLGLKQLLQRKRLQLVDSDILALGAFYLLVIGMYLLFEKLALNYRPVHIQGILEASYPSSATLLTLCVMGTARMQLKRRIRRPRLQKNLLWAVDLFTGFMVTGRLFSGVHWLTDIVGGIFLGAGLLLLYRWAAELLSRKLCGQNQS